MATKMMMKNERTGKFKKTCEGFSWTALFFGPLVPLVRRDWKYFLLYMVVFGFLTNALPLEIAQYVGAAFMIGMAFIYNDLHNKDLLNKGFNFTDEVPEESSSFFFCFFSSGEDGGE